MDPRLDAVRPFAAVGYALCASAGFVLPGRRPPERRPVGAVLLYGLCLVFFLPAFVFDSPYAALAGLTAAHGYQYLVIMALVAAGGRRAGLNHLIALALLLGTGLNLASHLRSSASPGYVPCTAGISGW